MSFNDSLVGEIQVNISHVFGDDSTEVSKTHPITLTENAEGFILDISPAFTEWDDVVDSWIATGLSGEEPYSIQCDQTSHTVIQCHNGITTFRID
jgi:hypothetical protein